MRGIDLARFQFDYDLTFGALLMHPAGHVYHRYGGRDYRDASRWLDMRSLEELLIHTLGDHKAREASALQAAVRAEEPLRMEEIPAFQSRDKGACIHCHSVLPALYQEDLANGRWKPEQRWRYPSPLRLGFDLQRIEQRKVLEVGPGSPAAAGGLLPGDRITGLAGACVMTASDVMYQLDQFPFEGGRLSLEVERDGTSIELQLELPAAWKQGTPLSFSWRPFKWGFTPAPGFGGPALDRQALLAAGLIKPEHEGRQPFALRVNYLVTWGENKRFGQAAHAAGLRKNDIVTSIGGHQDFENPGHFHAWWRLTQRAGDKVELKILRAGKALTLSIKVQA